MFKSFKKKRSNKGFTLVELLVVIAIIGVLAVVAVPSLFKNIEKAKTAEAISYINAVKTAAISEYADNQGVTSEQILATVEGKKPSTIGAITATPSTTGIKVEVTVNTEEDKLIVALTDKFKEDKNITIK